MDVDTFVLGLTYVISVGQKKRITIRKATRHIDASWCWILLLLLCLLKNEEKKGDGRSGKEQRG